MRKFNLPLLTTMTVILSIFTAFLLAACGPAVKLPPVQEPLDSEEWSRCSGELKERESAGLIDDLTLDSKTLVCKGVVAAAEGKTNRAVELLTEAGVRDKEDHRPHYLAGRVLAEAGRYEEALAAFERSQERYPEMEVPAERLGRRVAKKDGDTQARTFLLKAEERGLCPYGCRGLLARLHHKAGDDDSARTLYETMIKDEPGEPSAYVGMASLSNATGDHMAESEWLTKATRAAHFKDLSTAAQADIHYSHAFARYNARKFKGGAASIDRATSLQGDRADWWVLSGWLQLNLKDPAIALTKFDKAATLDEKLSAAHIGRGDAMIELGREGDAVVAYERAKKQDPSNAVIILKLAHAKALGKDLDAARALLDEAITMDREHLPPELISKVTKLLQ